MHYGESFEQAAEYVRLALPLMARHQIPANPEHYAVWYEYVSGRNPELRDTLDAALTTPEQLSRELSQSLYEQHFRQTEAQQAEVLRNEVRNHIARMVEHLARSGDQADRYSALLQHYDSSLSQDMTPGEFQHLIDEFIRETQHMQTVNRELQDQLNTTQDELEQVRQELEITRQAAATDTLTGIYNRKSFDEKLAHHVGEARAGQDSLCLIMADIDHFKHFNDQHGHIVGDKLLRLVAQILKSSVKGQDTVARYGGEEFAVLLPATPLHGGLAVAESLRVAVQQQRLRNGTTRAPIGQITLSMGVAMYRPGETTEAFIQRADTALYQAKSTGRNRVTLETQLPAA